MEKIKNISVSTPAKTWEHIRNKLLSNNFSTSNNVNRVFIINNLNSHLINENMKSFDDNIVDHCN